jgi:hypothetical protein
MQITQHQPCLLIVCCCVCAQVRLLRVVRLVKLLARGELFPHSSSRYMTVSGWYMLSLCFCAAATNQPAGVHLVCNRQIRQRVGQ